MQPSCRNTHPVHTHMGSGTLSTHIQRNQRGALTSHRREHTWDRQTQTHTHTHAQLPFDHNTSASITASNVPPSSPLCSWCLTPDAQPSSPPACLPASPSQPPTIKSRRPSASLFQTPQNTKNIIPQSGSPWRWGENFSSFSYSPQNNNHVDQEKRKSNQVWMSGRKTSADSQLLLLLTLPFLLPCVCPLSSFGFVMLS